MVRSAVHRPQRERHGRREDRDERAFSVLDQQRIGIDILAIGLELDALPGHDGTLTIGRAGAVEAAHHRTEESRVC
jgi:hypothetical protein